MSFHARRLPTLTNSILARSSLILAATLIIAVPRSAAQAETKIGSTVEARTVVGFAVPQAAAQAWLPEGWTVAPFGGGPLAGANLLLVFIDRHLALDADGAPEAIPQYRLLALVTPASHPDEEDNRIYVTRIYAPDASLNSYGNSVAADLSRSALHAVEGASPGEGEDSWSVGYDGGTLAFEMRYTGATPGASEGTANPYSSVDADFYRIYQYRQIVDPVMSVPAGIDRASEVAFSSTLPELVPMFDGSEEMVAILRLPVYTRDTLLP